MRPFALPILAALVFTGCSAAPSTSSPVGSEAAAPSASSGGIPAPASPGPSSSAPPSPTAPPTVTPTATPAAIRPAPSGPWTSIRWINTGKLPVDGEEDVTIFGWSGGFVALEQSSGTDSDGHDIGVVIRAWASTDGDGWSAPVTIETGFKGMFRIDAITEGPNGLLALAFPYGDTCGGPPRVAFMWASDDGRSWQKLAMPKAFAVNNVETISGGGAGYIARGTLADGSAAIWSSSDGRAWTSRRLPSVSSGQVLLSDAISFDGGFVLAGGVEGEGECGGPGLIHPAVWWSPDGAGWTRASLAGASTGPYLGLHVQRIGDRLLATQTTSDPAIGKQWSSVDGRSWEPAGQNPTDYFWRAVTDGRHAVAVLYGQAGVDRQSTLVTLEGTGATTTLAQQGDGPVIPVDGPNWNFALGPTGILAVLSNGAASRLGLPS